MKVKIEISDNEIHKTVDPVLFCSNTSITYRSCKSDKMIKVSRFKRIIQLKCNLNEYAVFDDKQRIFSFLMGVSDEEMMSMVSENPNHSLEEVARKNPDKFKIVLDGYYDLKMFDLYDESVDHRHVDAGTYQYTFDVNRLIKLRTKYRQENCGRFVTLMVFKFSTEKNKTSEGFEGVHGVLHIVLESLL